MERVKDFLFWVFIFLCYSLIILGVGVIIGNNIGNNRSSVALDEYRSGLEEIGRISTELEESEIRSLGRVELTRKIIEANNNRERERLESIKRSQRLIEESEGALQGLAETTGDAREKLRVAYNTIGKIAVQLQEFKDWLDNNGWIVDSGIDS